MVLSTMLLRRTPSLEALPWGGILLLESLRSAIVGCLTGALPLRRLFSLYVAIVVEKLVGISGLVVRLEIRTGLSTTIAT